MGNATLICRECKAEVDKGAPAISGQDDTSFVCEGCQAKRNAARLATLLPTVDLDGSK